MSTNPSNSTGKQLDPSANPTNRLSDRKSLSKLGDKSHAFVKKAVDIAAHHPQILPGSHSVEMCVKVRNCFKAWRPSNWRSSSCIVRCGIPRSRSAAKLTPSLVPSTRRRKAQLRARTWRRPPVISPSVTCVSRRRLPLQPSQRRMRRRPPRIPRRRFRRRRRPPRLPPPR